MLLTTMAKPIFDHSLPYIGPIYGRKFTPGKLIRIQGIAPGVAYRFNIQLQCGPDIAPRDDVAIQVSVRLLEGYIIINSLQNGIWDEEQRGTVMPIKRAEIFEIILMCDYSHYKVAINGQHYCEFPQRIHYDRITHLAIDGDVSIMQISYESAAGGGMGSNSRSMIYSTSSPQGNNSIPPSCGLAVHGASYSTAAPYPSTGAAYPTSGTSYPTSGVSHPTSGATYPTSGAPYPTSGARYPTSGVPYPTTGATYPTAGAPYCTSGVPPGTSYTPGMPPPPPGPLVPLNFSPQAKQGRDLQKLCGVCGAAVFSILIISLVVFKLLIII